MPAMASSNHIAPGEMKPIDLQRLPYAWQTWLRRATRSLIHAFIAAVHHSRPSLREPPSLVPATEAGWISPTAASQQPLPQTVSEPIESRRTVTSP
jgi:hypothetical protein